MKKILIDATGSVGWIGGVYHKKNIVFSLLQNEWIRNNCGIFLVTNPEHRKVFDEFSGEVKILTVRYKGVRDRKLKIALCALLHRCRFIFPNVDRRVCDLLHITGINWVPDYQHYHFEKFFPEEELESRRQIDRMTADPAYPLVLSSNACLDDFRHFVSGTKENVYIVPFVSYIEKDAESITEDMLSEVCDKYGVTPGRYIMIANQFWQHKNHKVALEAIRLISDRLSEHPYEDIGFVFTGQLSDYRDGGYIDQIRALLSDPFMKDRCICTGFIDRREQLALMRGAYLIIQPSLFEGWGTVLEDAKVLDKTVLLSDIPVHREQRNEKCFLFDPHDPEELGRLILSKLESGTPPDDLSSGIARMYTDALKYSTGFEKLLKEY